MAKGNMQVFMEGDASGLGTALQNAQQKAGEDLAEWLTPAGLAKVKAAEAELADVVLLGDGDE